MFNSRSLTMRTLVAQESIVSQPIPDQENQPKSHFPGKETLVKEGQKQGNVNSKVQSEGALLTGLNINRASCRCPSIYFRLEGVDNGGLRCMTEEHLPCRTATSALVKVSHIGMRCSASYIANGMLLIAVSLIMLHMLWWESFSKPGF